MDAIQRPTKDTIIIMERGDNTWCYVNLFGGNIVSWRVDNVEQIFISRVTKFDDNYPITGGIPFYFPVYGPWKRGPKDGFAHLQKWSIKQPARVLKNKDIQVTLQLKHNEYTHSLWPYYFILEKKITVGESHLIIQLKITNVDKQDITFQAMLSPFIKVSSLANIQLNGFQSMHFVNYDDEELVIHKSGEPEVKGTEKLHRFYEKSPDTHYVIEHGKRVIKVTTIDFSEIMVWNPGATSINTIEDIDADEFDKFVCISPANVYGKITLHPQETWEAKTVLRYIPSLVNPLEKIDKLYMFGLF